MSIGIWNVVGIVIIIFMIVGVGVYSGSKVKDADDFATGGGAGALMVCGAIMGSLVSGQATVGTAQLAFTYGLSAWWFTLGAGIGCLILAIGYAIPLRRSGQMTLMQVVGEEYGSKAEYVGSVLCSIGIFISVISQVIAAAALLMTIFHMNMLWACVLSAALMAGYVIFGGAWGAGMGGILKLVLLYGSCVIGFFIVCMLSGNVSQLFHSLEKLLAGTDLGQLSNLSSVSVVKDRYFSLVARGAMKDIGSGLSLILGVLSTQTYAQAIWSGKKDSSARKGALLSAFLVPPIGIACTLIGLFMRVHYITTDEIAALKAAGQAVPDGLMEITSTAQAFPVFAVTYMPQLLGGIVLGTLLIAVVGGGAGLSLGMASIVVNDILKKINEKFKDIKTNLVATRTVILIILLLAVVIAVIVPGAVINDFGFLSMGIRGTVVFIPLTMALFCKGKVQRQYIIAACVIGPAAVLVGNILKLPFDSLFLGVICCLFIVGMGAVLKRNKKDMKHSS